MSERITSVPSLFAAHAGVTCCGPMPCFFCGAKCDGTNKSDDYVRDSFTSRNDVVSPGSTAVCDGCVLCMRENATIATISGGTRHVEKCAMRAFSWVITKEKALAASKANIEELRSICCDPPVPPFAIVISDSGQKHLLYRGVTCWSREDVTVTLEMETVSYKPPDLIKTINLCTKLIAATGKPALSEPATQRFAQAVSDYFDEWESLLDEWESIYGKPIARLGAWLSPGKDAARISVKPTKNDGLSGVQKEIGGTYRSEQEDRGQRKNKRKADGNPTLFDFC